MRAAASQYATFLVGDHYLGIDVLNVQEVLQAQRLRPCPWRRPWSPD